jgi:hypothetical protein
MAVTPTYTVPEDYKSGLKDVLAEAKNIYETQKGLGYQTYGGPRIAGFSPDEQAAMQGIAGLVGTGQQYFNPAAALTLGQTQRFDPATAAQYMSPYQQAVVDVEKREAVRQAQVPMQQIRQQAAGAGGYGGSRQAILEAENIRNLQNRLGDIQTTGSQAAYETGLRSFEAQKERERAAASGLSALGQAVPRQALTELTALSGIGEAQRGMTQTGLDIAYQEAEAQKQFPYQALGQYQSTLYGYPYQSYGQFQPTAQPSSSQNLAGILGAVGKIGSGFNFFNSGGRVAYQTGGGLSGMIQKLADGMSVGSDKDMSPSAQQLNKAKLASKMLESYSGLQESIGAYGSAAEEAYKKQAELAEQREAELKKQSSPINYISDLLIGYAAANPESGLGAQLAGAATYAEEQRSTVNNEIRQIQKDLAEGKISQAEANLKIRQAEIKASSDIADVFDTDTDIESADIGQLKSIAAQMSDVKFYPDTGVLEGTPEAKTEYLNILKILTNAFKESGGDYTKALEALSKTRKQIKDPVDPDAPSVPIDPDSPAAKADKFKQSKKISDLAPKPTT